MRFLEVGTKISFFYYGYSRCSNWEYKSLKREKYYFNLINHPLKFCPLTSGHPVHFLKNIFFSSFYISKDADDLDTDYSEDPLSTSATLSSFHVTTHSQPSKILSEDSQRDNGRSAKKFYCLVCGETFRYQLLLKRHMTELHETQKLFQVNKHSIKIRPEGPTNEYLKFGPKNQVISI